MEPVTTLAAGALIKLVFDEFIKSGAGELAKESLSGARELVKPLRDKIVASSFTRPKLYPGIMPAF